MSAVVVALMVCLVLLLGLGAVLLAAKGLRAEVDKVHAGRARSAERKD